MNTFRSTYVADGQTPHGLATTVVCIGRWSRQIVNLRKPPGTPYVGLPLEDKGRGVFWRTGDALELGNVKSFELYRLHPFGPLRPVGTLKYRSSPDPSRGPAPYSAAIHAVSPKLHFPPRSRNWRDQLIVRRVNRMKRVRLGEYLTRTASALVVIPRPRSAW